MNVTVYVDGKRVTKEEISKIEMKNEDVKRILLEAGKPKQEKGR